MTPVLLILLLASSLLLVTLRLRRRTAERARDDLRTIFETAPIGNLVLDDEDRIVAANAAIGRIAGCPPQELGGQPLARLVHDEDLALLRIALAQLRHDVTAELATEVRMLDAASGAAVTTAIHAAVLHGAADGARRMLIQVLDITERKRVEAQLQHLADHDPLTSLLNRRRFEQELERHLAQARRYGAEGAAIVLDVDGFKLVNDTLGHCAGDRLIVRVAEVLRERLRGTDVLARLGGDEFAILLPKADRAGAEAVARSLVETIRTRAALDGEHPVTISVGVAMVDPLAEQRSPDAIIAAADLAMYEAKAAGRNRYAFHVGGLKLTAAAAPKPKPTPLAA